MSTEAKLPPPEAFSYVNVSATPECRRSLAELKSSVDELGKEYGRGLDEQIGAIVSRQKEIIKTKHDFNQLSHDTQYDSYNLGVRIKSLRRDQSEILWELHNLSESLDTALKEIIERTNALNEIVPENKKISRDLYPRLYSALHGEGGHRLLLIPTDNPTLTNANPLPGSLIDVIRGWWPWSKESKLENSQSDMREIVEEEADLTVDTIEALEPPNTP